MTDQWGRTIDYLRVSVTDRCNLRCRYCMPRGVELCSHSDTLRYEELLRVCAAAAALGVTRFKITGGEPLVRRDCAAFLARLKALPGVEQVTLTTNALLLSQCLDELAGAGVDGINISLDTLDPERYRRITGFDGGAVEQVLTVLDDCVRRGIRTKINAVLLPETRDEPPRLAALAAGRPVDVRFIELMPIGEGRGLKGVSPDEALARLRAVWPDLHPTDERRGNGPAQYYAAAALEGRIGFIGAVSHAFCAACNRVRLTSTGVLKPCLCYEEGTDLRSLLRGGCTDEALARAMAGAIRGKPLAHCFAREEGVSERRAMFQIGG